MYNKIQTEYQKELYTKILKIANILHKKNTELAKHTFIDEKYITDLLGENVNIQWTIYMDLNNTK